MEKKMENGNTIMRMEIFKKDLNSENNFTNYFIKYYSNILNYLSSDFYDLSEAFEIATNKV